MSNDPSNPARKEANSFPQMVAAGVQAALEDLYTCMPGIVDRVNDDGTVSVLPTISTIVVNDDGEQQVNLPKINKVPVHSVGSGGYSISLKVEKGDEGILIFSQRALDDWKKFGDIRPPSNRRFHEATDAFFLPGASSNKNRIATPTDGLEIKHADGMKITVQTDSASIETPDGTVFNISEGGYASVDNSAVNLPPVGGELFDLLTQALDAIATSNCPPGAPLTNALNITLLSTRLKTFINTGP